MGLWDFLKKKLTPETKAHGCSSNETPIRVSNEEYQEKRDKEIAWLEKHYDLSSTKGIQSIPERSDLPRPTFGDCDGFRSYTGDIDYYLRQKSAEYEDAENVELAILCLRKSNAIRMASRRGYKKDDYYSLVRLLARSGFVDEAKAEKLKIDSFFGKCNVDAYEDYSREMINRVLTDARKLGTDLVEMSAHDHACPECAKYQGRVFSLSGSDKRFPKIPQAFFLHGCIHEGCAHTFFPIIYGAFVSNLSYTLSVHKIKDRKYTKDIIAFSNRPFVDDRPQEDIDAAIKLIEENRIAAERKKEFDDHMIEREYQRGISKRHYKWIQKNLPDLCPKSISGYTRMKNSNSKNFQKIVAAAKDLGYNIE